MRIRSEIKVITGAPLEGTNPLPKFRARKPSYAQCDADFPNELKIGLAHHTKVLPYLLQDRYSRKRIPLKLKCLVLENEYLRAEFLPEYGGRLYSLYDKVNGYELVLRNPVIQPGNLAIRNAWLSGGIEWNCGNVGHCATTCDNVFAAILRDDDGNDFLRIYEFERLKSIFWQVDFHLPDDSPHLISHVRLVNPYDEDTTIYWWSNVAVEDAGKTRVLASGKNIVSFVEGTVCYERLPYIKAMPGPDISYPSNATRSFDFFIQPNTAEECTWEAAAYENGVVFYERSTPPLSCKKMFCWGNHRSGKHWQEYLSDEGNGYYAEIQAGIAPSQLHDRLFPKNGTLEWTQCFGGVKLEAERLNDSDYHRAVDYLGAAIDGRLDTAKITELDERLKTLADVPVSADRLIHCGSGFGALEIRKMKREGKGVAPKSLCFSESTVGKTEYPWAYLLEKGVLPREDVRDMVPTYMISNKWLPWIEKSLAKEETWYSLLQYGIAVYEGADHTKTAGESYSEEDALRRVTAAEKAWLKSVSLEPSVWGYRNLAVLEDQRGNADAAEAYYDRAIALPGAFDDYALAAEYLDFLAKRQKPEKLWTIYESLPQDCKEKDRIDICAAFAAERLSKLEFLDGFFKRSHYDIREGEDSLTDIWFAYSARKLAAERGIAESDSSAMEALVDEVWDRCPPPAEIDFRMSLDRKNKYRI